MNPVNSILNIPLFSGLSRHELARVAGFLEEKSFAAGEVIFNEGDAGDALYVAASGIVEILSNSGSPGRETLALLGPRECFGEMGLFTGEPRSATARAAVSSVVFKLDKPSWDKVLHQYPSISRYFCEILSKRLMDADIHLVGHRDALNLALTDFLGGQPPHVQDLLLKASALRIQDPDTINQCFAVTGADGNFERLSSAYPSLIRHRQDGRYRYSRPFQEFLYRRLQAQVTLDELEQIHARCAAYFKEKSAWRDVLDQCVRGSDWDGACAVVHAHTDEIVSSSSTEELLDWLDQTWEEFPARRNHLKLLRAETFVHLGEFDSAITCYRELLGESSSAALDEPGSYFEQQARTHQEAGNHQDALTSLDRGLEAMSARILEDRMVEHQILAGEARPKPFDIVRQLGLPTKAQVLARYRVALGALLSLIVAPLVWNWPPPGMLTTDAMHFLATMAVAVILWVTECFDEYVVAIALLLSWLFLDLAPPEIALSGFSSSSWFLVLGVFGMAAAVSRAGLLYRVTLRLIESIPPSYKKYTAIMAASGVLATPILPTSRGRVAMIMPLCREISDSLGFAPRSNGSAGLVLSAFVGFGSMGFMFLTGATYTLLGWNLLPPSQRADFTWATWFLAALPTGVVTLAVLFAGILLLFPVKESSLSQVSTTTLKTQIDVMGPLTRREWMSLVILTLVMSGFVFGSRFGLEEPWIALSGLLAFTLVGDLDKDGLKRGIDWASLIFFGVVAGLAGIVSNLHIDRWLEASFGPVLSEWFIHPFVFLLLAAFFVLLIRFLLPPLPTFLLLTIFLVPCAEDQAVHPGVLLITLALATNTWFFAYQDACYQIAYFGSEGRSFSHTQARKLMCVQTLAIVIAITISVPYWRFLGFIQ